MVSASSLFSRGKPKGSFKKGGANPGGNSGTPNAIARPQSSGRGGGSTAVSGVSKLPAKGKKR